MQLPARVAMQGVAVRRTGLSRAPVPRVPTLAVVRQDLDHPAFSDAAMAASLDHHFQFRLERGQTADALLNLAKVYLGDHVGRRAWLARVVLQGQQRPYGLDPEAQFAGMANERDAAQIGSLVVATIALAASRCRQ